MSTCFQEKVWKKCKQIPAGKISTYGKVARAIGAPRAARAVGNALNKNKSVKVPCHRVVKRNGEVGGYVHGRKAKEKKLKKEGVLIKKGKIVDFEKKRYWF